MESDLIPYGSINCFVAEQVLVLAPHPDDEIFGCGGAIAAHLESGCRVHVCVLTDGAWMADCGDNEAVKTYASIRIAESTKAAGLLGYGVPEFWNLPDRALLYGEFLIGLIISKLESLQPDLVYCPSFYEVHPDHRAAAMATIEAVRRSNAELQVAMYEVGAPLPRPTHLLDITRFELLKENLINCFESQLSQHRYDITIAGLNRYRTYTLPSSTKVAEAYEVVTSHEIRHNMFSVLRSVYSHDIGKQVSSLGNLDFPLVTVIIRSIHRLHLLRHALHSIEVQTYPSVEVVIVSAINNTHPPVEASKKYSMRLIEENTQCLDRSSAGNKGLLGAQGQFIMFLDDDDFLMPDHISKLVNSLQSNPSAILAYTGVGLADKDGTTIPGGYCYEFKKEDLIASNQMPIHAALFRKNVIELGCRMDCSLSFYEDWDFWLQVACLGAFVFAPGISAYYRKHDSSGVDSDKVTVLRSYNQLIDKWRSLWPDEMLRNGLMHLGHASLTARDRISDLENNIHHRDSRIAQLNEVAADQRLQISELESEIAQLNQMVAGLRLRIASIMASRSWKITRPLRSIGDAARKFFSNLQ